MFFVNGDNGQRDVEEEDAEANQRKRIGDDRLHQIGPYLFLSPLKPIPSPCSPLSVSSPSNNW